MLSSAQACARRYDPYERKLTTEAYDQAGMRAVRRAAVEAAVPARRWGLVLGTLGRQARQNGFGSGLGSMLGLKSGFTMPACRSCSAPSGRQARSHMPRLPPHSTFEGGNEPAAASNRTSAWFRRWSCC